MNEETVIMIIVMPTMFVIMGWAFKTGLDFFHKQRLIKLHYALQDKLLEKLGNSPEAIEYLHSDAGEKMFALATKERTNPYARILTALQTGAVLVFARNWFHYSCATRSRLMVPRPSWSSEFSVSVSGSVSSPPAQLPTSSRNSGG